jgi:hypothetical protein
MKTLLQIAAMLILSNFAFGQAGSCTGEGWNLTCESTNGTLHVVCNAAGCTHSDGTRVDMGKLLAKWVAPETHAELTNIGDFCKALHLGSKRSFDCKEGWDMELNNRALIAEHDQAEKDTKARAAAFEAKYAVKALTPRN